MSTLAETFAARVTEAAARALNVEPEAMLAAAGVSGRPAGEVAILRERFGDLAFEIFPLSTSPSRSLLRLCRGEGAPRPLWETLEALERGLGVEASSLLERSE